MKKIKDFKYLIIVLVIFPILGISCKKNTDVIDPTPEPIELSTALSEVERSISNMFSLGSELGNTIAIYTHQVTGRVAADRYGAGSIGWDELYGIIKKLNAIIKRGTEEKCFVYVGIAKILKSYTFSMMVDLWGDIPFSEFDKVAEGIKHPKFDDDSEIYGELRRLIDAGIADINNQAPNPSLPSSDDLIYQGNRTNWIKAANTIKLKLFVQISRIHDVRQEINTLLINRDVRLISSQAENFAMPYNINDRHPGYKNYTATERGNQLFSPWLYEIMKGRNPRILTGISDPRIPYYIYNQKSAPGGSNPNPENCTDYRDGGFISILFGSNGPCRNSSNNQSYSLLGIYPVGGRYDDGAAKSVNELGTQNAGTGARPHQFITYADRLYLEAEYFNAEYRLSEARAAFSKALDESFNQIDYVITNHVKPSTAGAPQTVPLIATQAATATYKARVMADYDAADYFKRFELIMTQKWINRIENPIDNYTDYRRRGYPVLFSPAPVGNVTSVTSPDGSVTPVFNSKKYPLSLPYDVHEILRNLNAPAQKNTELYKIFWQQF